MDVGLQAKIYRLFYKFALPCSRIDRVLNLPKGSAKTVIKHSWWENPSYVQAMIGVDEYGTDSANDAG